jgi:hypothetical protein
MPRVAERAVLFAPDEGEQPQIAPPSCKQRTLLMTAPGGGEKHTNAPKSTPRSSQAKDSGIYLASARTSQAPDPPGRTLEQTQRLGKFDSLATSPPSRQPGHLFVCITGPYMCARVLFNLTGIETDEEWFQAMHCLYRRTRGWARLFFKVTEVHFAQVGLRLKHVLLKNLTYFR